MAQVQCAPMPPTFVEAAAAGKVGACPEPSPPKSMRCVPWRAVNMPSTTTPSGRPSDSRNAPACGPCDISRARAFSAGSAMLRTLSPGISVSCGPASNITTRASGRPLDQQPGVGGADRTAADDGDGGVVRHGVSSSGVGRGVMRWPLRRRRLAGRSMSSDSRPFGQQQGGDDADGVGERETEEDRRHARSSRAPPPATARPPMRRWTACGVRVEASRDAGSPAATPAPMSPPTTAVAAVDPIWRTRLTRGRDAAGVCARSGALGDRDDDVHERARADADEAHREHRHPQRQPGREQRHHDAGRRRRPTVPMIGKIR